MIRLQSSTRRAHWPLLKKPSTLCAQCVSRRLLLTTLPNNQEAQILLREEPAPAKRVRPIRSRPSSPASLHDNEKWKVTVGLEIHAQLNSRRKLFSNARTTFNASPNTHVAMFDAAIPGAQPKLNLPTVLPALRAALALNCTINRRSTFDRKHYFYKDQPCGYQITQFYEALANDGTITLTEWDGLLPESDAKASTSEPVEVGIKQVQLEQDTAKSIYQPSTSPSEVSQTLIDLNRAASPLIEIITTPSLHSSHHASICLKKIQGILKSSLAAVEGMERGGVRCDVNVSVRERDREGLGQRVEIKNLNSIKAVQESIDFEVLRQIELLESGGLVEGETRGWDALAGKSKKLRGKEGEVDYRYMPDAELPALVLDDTLIEHVRSTLPKLPEQIMDEITSEPYELTVKDARSLLALDDGGRVLYYTQVADRLFEILPSNDSSKHLGRLAGNWVLHELGGWLSSKSIAWAENPVSAEQISDLLIHLQTGHLTGANAKHAIDILTDMRPDNSTSVADLITKHNLAAEVNLNQDAELTAIAERLIAENAQKAQLVRSGKKPGLLNFFVGGFMRETGGKVNVERCKQAIEKLLLAKKQ